MLATKCRWQLKFLWASPITLHPHPPHKRSLHPSNSYCSLYCHLPWQVRVSEQQTWLHHILKYIQVTIFKSTRLSMGQWSTVNDMPTTDPSIMTHLSPWWPSMYTPALHLISTLSVPKSVAPYPYTNRISCGRIVTHFTWIVHRFMSSNRPMR